MIALQIQKKRLKSKGTPMQFTQQVGFEIYKVTLIIEMIQVYLQVLKLHFYLIAKPPFLCIFIGPVPYSQNLLMASHDQQHTLKIADYRESIGSSNHKSFHSNMFYIYFRGFQINHISISCLSYD